MNDGIGRIVGDKEFVTEIFVTDNGKVTGLIYDSEAIVIPEGADWTWQLSPEFLELYLADCQFSFSRTQHDLLVSQLEGLVTVFSGSWSVEGGNAGEVDTLRGEEASTFMRKYMSKRTFLLRDISEPRSCNICRRYLIKTNWKGFFVQRLARV